MYYPVYYGLDLAATFFLAWAAGCRAGVYGMHFTGAVVLGLLAGLISPVLRDMLLSLGSVGPLHDHWYAVAALAGAVGGRALSQWRSPLVFRWTEALALGLATAMGASRAQVLGFPPVGCILLGLVAGLAGGLARDLCLGDTPAALEREFYATASAVGAMFVVAQAHYGLIPTFQVLMAAWLVLVLRQWGHSRAMRRGDNS